MIVAYRKPFLKELAKIPASRRSSMEHFVFEILPEAESLHQLGNIEQMKGYPLYFKVRFGPYRIGIRLDGDTVVLERVLHRKDIYRHFP